MSTKLQLKPPATSVTTMAGWVGKEVRLIFTSRDAARTYYENIVKQQPGWSYEGHMSGTSIPPWPMRRLRRK